MAVYRGFHCIGSKRADQIAYSVLMCPVDKPWRRFWQNGPLSYGFCNLTERGDDVDLLFDVLSASAAQKKVRRRRIRHHRFGYDLWRRWKSLDFQPWQIQPLMVSKFQVNELQL